MDRETERKGDDSHEASCTDCGLLNCYRQESRFPDFCPGESVGKQTLEGITGHYCGEDEDARAAKAAAEVEGLYYGKLTRVEEVLAFARRIGARKIGLATCVGLVEETRLFSKMLRQNGFDPYAVLCKIGSTDKTEIGIEEELKLRPESFEALCNPLLQAKMLNDWKSDLNVVIGLCVGHDALFCRHSEALVTTLIVKDRVLAHNPAAALYTSRSYYKRVMDTGRNL